MTDDEYRTFVAAERKKALDLLRSGNLEARPWAIVRLRALTEVEISEVIHESLVWDYGTPPSVELYIMKPEGKKD